MSAPGDRLSIRVCQPVQGCEVELHTLLKSEDGDAIYTGKEVHFDFQWFRSACRLACANPSCPTLTPAHPSPARATLQCLQCAHLRVRPVSRGLFCSGSCMASAWPVHHAKCHAREGSASGEASADRPSRATPASASAAGDRGEASTPDAHIVTGPAMLPALEAALDAPVALVEALIRAPDEVAGRWVHVASTKLYRPSVADVGHALRLVCSASEKDTGRVVAVKEVTTPLVFAAPSFPPSRYMLRSRRGSVPSGVPLRVATYNVLAEVYATQQVYPHCPVWALSWAFRCGRVVREILSLNADVLCLQEVQQDHFEQHIHPQLHAHGYEALFKPKTRMYVGRSGKVDGCALAFRRDRFAVVDVRTIEFNELARQQAATGRPGMGGLSPQALARLMRDNVAQVAILQTLQRVSPQGVAESGGLQFCVCNTHLFWDPEFADVKLWQAHMLMLQLEKILARYRDLPLLMCGDFNSTPDNAVYPFVADGGVPMGHPDLAKDVHGVLPPSHRLAHSVQLASAYVDATGREPELTNMGGMDFVGVLDYLWFTPSSLAVAAVLQTRSEQELLADYGCRLPNPCHPSDHISLAADFVLASTVSQHVPGHPAMAAFGHHASMR